MAKTKSAGTWVEMQRRMVVVQKRKDNNQDNKKRLPKIRMIMMLILTHHLNRVVKMQKIRPWKKQMNLKRNLMCVSLQRWKFMTTFGGKPEDFAPFLIRS